MQAIVVDLDAGDIIAKLAHLVHHLGTPTLVVESGGRTPEGGLKLHVWWKLTEAASGEDLATLCRLRGDIAMKVGGDTHFRSAHQPIRVAGSVYHKGGFQRLVQIREHNAIELDLGDFGERVAAMPFIPGMGAEPPAEGHMKPSLDAILTTPVHEGGADAWTRFEGASAAIGHYVRLVHEGKLSPNDGWEAICQYNAAMLRPAWPVERLQQEADRIWALHAKKNGPALLRKEADPEHEAQLLPVFSFGQLLDDRSPMPPDIIAPRVLTRGGLLVLGGAPKVGKSDFLISLLAHMAAGVPFLGFTPPQPLRVFYLQAEIQYHYDSSLGVVIERVMTGNGSCYKSHDFAAACRRFKIGHIRTRPYAPDQRKGGTLHPDRASRMGLRQNICGLPRTLCRTAHLASQVQLAQATRQPKPATTRQPVPLDAGQPVEVPKLGIHGIGVKFRAVRPGCRRQRAQQEVILALELAAPCGEDFLVGCPLRWRGLWKV